MGIFLKIVIPPQEEPQAGPSEGVSEEGILIIGDDRSMSVIASGDPLLGQNVEVEDSYVNDPDHV